MTKKITHIFTIIAATVAASLCDASATNAPVGQWTLYPVFSVPATQVVETSAYVYGVAGGNLFSYDPANDERRSLTVDNLLTDYNVTKVFYNPRKKYLAVAYDGGNIDLLYDDGRVINLPDIKMATSITSSRNINDMAFDGDRMYVATDFGVVVYDDERGEVVRSGNLGQAVTGIAVKDSYLIVVMGNKGYRADKDGQVNKLDRFTSLYNVTQGIKVIPFDATGILYHCATGKFWIADHTAADLTKAKWTEISAQTGTVTSAVQLADSTVMFVGSGALYRLNRDRSVEKLADIPDEFKSAVNTNYSFNKGAGNVWVLGNDGLGLFSFEGGTTTVRKDKYMPETMVTKEVASIIPSADGRRIYFTNLGPTRLRLSNPGEGETTLQQTCVLSNDRFINVTPYPVEAKSSVARSWQGSTRKWIISPSRLAEDPNDPSTYFIGTNTDGVYRVTDGKESGHFDINNSPIAPAWSNSSRIFEVGFDNGGNLWIVGQRFSATEDTPLVMVLPASKVSKPTDQITAGDWVVIDIPTQERGDRNPRLLFCKQSNMVFIAMSGLVAIDTKGTLSNFKDDTVTAHSTFTDQDGKSFSYTTVLSLCEDRQGRVWVGTDQGIFEITNPTSANSTSMVVNHLKIPRNDGTNTAEYLLPADYIYGMSADNANRKWVATRSSGLFLVSDRGDAILANYTSDNSILPDNMVHDVYADPNSNNVWIGTSQGLISFATDASPVQPDYSDIYAYPNPVRPDHTGPICIAGLMEGTMVKITDAAGKLVAQTMAEGGMAQWDGCNLSGQRVRSGVYYVFASSGGGDSTLPSSGAVTKILVVN